MPFRLSLVLLPSHGHPRHRRSKVGHQQEAKQMYSRERGTVYWGQDIAYDWSM
jgi:hypothetical protein